MKVWIFVEGKSDVQALLALWSGWKQKLSEKGWGIQLIRFGGPTPCCDESTSVPAQDVKQAQRLATTSRRAESRQTP